MVPAVISDADHIIIQVSFDYLSRVKDLGTPYNLDIKYIYCVNLLKIEICSCRSTHSQLVISCSRYLTSIFVILLFIILVFRLLFFVTHFSAPGPFLDTATDKLIFKYYSFQS